MLHLKRAVTLGVLATGLAATPALAQQQPLPPAPAGEEPTAPENQTPPAPNGEGTVTQPPAGQAPVAPLPNGGGGGTMPPPGAPPCPACSNTPGANNAPPPQGGNQPGCGCGGPGMGGPGGQPGPRMGQGCGPGGPGWMDREHEMMMHRPRKTINVVLRPFYDANNGRLYTGLGFEALRTMPGDWQSGFASYHGLDLADLNDTDLIGTCGWLVQKNLLNSDRWGLDIGALLGMGYTIDFTQSLGPSNFGLFFAGEPRVSVSYKFNRWVGIQLGASYLLTTRPTSVAGPSVMLGLSFTPPKMDWRR